uniref:hypothetical protein n=1 Tax=Prevotella sp. TaxID=59823 RepID=UPI004026B207
MFQGLRPNSIFYVLDKSGEPTLKIGQVISVSNPQPKFPYQPGQFNPQLETTVDVKVKMQDGEAEFKQLPSNGQIANSDNLVVAESREAMSAEVEAMLRHSKEVLDSKNYHEKVVKNCEQMLGILNPQIAKEKAQEQRIGNLEADVSGMKGTLSNIETMLQRALNKKSNGNT